MASRAGVLLQWFGALTLASVAALTIGGLVVLKDRVQFTIQLDQGGAIPDPVALLRDEIAALQLGIEQLRAGQVAQAERLGEALEQRAEARHAELRQQLASILPVVELVARQREAGRVQSQQLDRLYEEVAALRGQYRGLAWPPVVVRDTPLDALPIVGTNPLAGVAAADPAPVDQLGLEATLPAAAKRSFLSFRLPEDSGKFTDPTDYALIQDLCRVGFDAKSTLHDFTGVTTQVRGEFHTDFSTPAGPWRGRIEAVAARLVTGVEGRDEGLRERLDIKNHPQIVFTVSGYDAEVADLSRREARGTIRGIMAIRGKERDLAMQVRFSMDPQQRLLVEGQASLKLSDYDVPVPSQLGGAITMQDEVVVWVALRARQKVKGAK